MALLGEGDRWMAQAQATYKAGTYDQSAAESGIAAALYTRAALEKPDAWTSLVNASLTSKPQIDAARARLEESVGRHPAGSKQRPRPRLVEEEPERSDDDDTN
jgi:hypothetical protein